MPQNETSNLLPKKIMLLVLDILYHDTQSEKLYYPISIVIIIYQYVSTLFEYRNRFKVHVLYLRHLGSKLYAHNSM